MKENTTGASLCFLTPSYIGDIERFATLRRSIRLFAPGLRHVAIVHTEDCGEFHDRFRGDTDLEIVRTADVLPWSVERRRKKSRRWRQLAGRLCGPVIKGWHAQQLAKIFTLAESPYEAAVFMDSDVFICRPLTRDYFYVDGRLKLFRRRAVNAEQCDFDVATHDIMGNPLHTIGELYDYIYHPACFRKSTALALFVEFERRGLWRTGRWVRRFLREKRPSEYNLLGYAATVLEGCAGYHLLQCDPEDLHHSIRYPEDRGRLSAEFELMHAHPKPFALVQSTLGVDFVCLGEVFDRLAESYAAASAPEDVGASVVSPK